MNKHIYKVIFSKVLAKFVVVSELAKSAGKAQSESVKTQLKPTALDMLNQRTQITHQSTLAENQASGILTFKFWN